MSETEEKQDTLEFQSNAELRSLPTPSDSLSFSLLARKKKGFPSSANHHAGP